MRVGRKIDIDLTIQSFKRYLKFVLFQAKCTVEVVKKNPYMQDADYDRYADAFYIVSKNEEFELLLTPSEYSSIRYYHYHNPIDTKPSDYDACFTNAYKKWCFVFFPNQDGRFVDIDAMTLGAMMRLFREKANRTKTELGKILGVDRTAISFYEEGKRMPSINYLYHFCEYFQISMDEIISRCIQ